MPQFFFKEYLRPNLRCPPRWSQQGQSWDPPEKSRFWYCPWSLCFSQHWKIAISNYIYYIATEDRASRTCWAHCAGSYGRFQGWGVWREALGCGGCTGCVDPSRLSRPTCPGCSPEIMKKIYFLNKEAAYYRFRHLWKWSLLQWILARHNTWVKTDSVNIVHLKQCIINVS